MDGLVQWAASTARTFVKAIPNPQCFDLGAFGYSSSLYTSQFATPNNPIGTNLLYFDATSGTEVHYACLDLNRAYALADYVQSMGFPVPNIVLKVASQIFRFIHVDGIVVFSGTGSNIGSGVTSAIQAALNPLSYNLAKNAAAFTC